MAEKIYVNVALSNADTCVCCDENGTVVDCCIVGADFGGMYHPDGIDAAQVWAAEHIDLMRTLSNQVSECCAGKCQASSEEGSGGVLLTPSEVQSASLFHSGGIDAAKEWAESHEGLGIQDADCHGAEALVVVDAGNQLGQETAPTSSLLEEPNDADTDTEATDGGTEGDGLVVVEIPEGVVTKSGNLSDPQGNPEGEGDEIMLLEAGLPESCLDELMGAGLDTPEKVLAHEDLSQIKGIGVKTRDKILRILNEAE